MSKKKPTPKPAPGTTPTQIRLTDDDKAVIEKIRVHFGLPSMAAAIRYAVQQLAKRVR